MKIWHKLFPKSVSIKFFVSLAVFMGLAFFEIAALGGTGFSLLGAFIYLGVSRIIHRKDLRSEHKEFERYTPIWVCATSLIPFVYLILTRTQVKLEVDFFATIASCMLTVAYGFCTTFIFVSPDEKLHNVVVKELLEIPLLMFLFSFLIGMIAMYQTAHGGPLSDERTFYLAYLLMVIPSSIITFIWCARIKAGKMLIPGQCELRKILCAIIEFLSLAITVFGVGDALCQLHGSEPLTSIFPGLSWYSSCVILLSIYLPFKASLLMNEILTEKRAERARSHDADEGGIAVEMKSSLKSPD